MLPGFTRFNSVAKPTVASISAVRAGESIVTVKPSIAPGAVTDTLTDIGVVISCGWSMSPPSNAMVGTAGGGVSSSVPSSPHATKRAAIMAIAMAIDTNFFIIILLK